MARTNKQLKEEYEADCRAFGSQQRELEAEVGILDAAKDARFNSYYPSPASLNAELFTEESAQKHEEDLLAENNRANRKLRALYFTVQETDMRRRLIKLERDITDRVRWASLAEVGEARNQLDAAKLTGNTWPLVCVVSGVMFVLIGSGIHQAISAIDPTTGAIAGAVCAYFMGHYYQQDARLRRMNAIRSAASNLRETEARNRRVVNEPYLFSQEELRRGEPDASPAG
jgi:hypothetical protein